MATNSVDVIRKPLSASNNKKPLVISSNKYKKILATVHREELSAKEAEEEQRFKEYLKNGSDALVAKWSDNFNTSQEQKQAERQLKLDAKAQQEKEEFMIIRQKDEQKRQEKIARAQELIQKQKPGPKELQSAAMTSETLKARTVQRNITKEFEATIKKRTAEETFQMECQSMPWIEEEQRRISNQIHRTNQYKAEILSAINENTRKKTESRKQELAESRAAQSICDQEIKAQIEKEQDMLKRKREALRKNALEAMIMVEQRKAREQIQDKVQGKLITIFNDGKQKIEKIKRTLQAETLQEQLQRNSANAQRLAAITPNIAAVEEERFRKDYSTIQLQFTAQEQEKIQRSRQQKLARIQEYFKELNAQKERKLQKTEEERLALANRLKNEEVNAAFEKKQKEEKIKKCLEVRKALAVQIEERKQVEAKEKEMNKKAAANSFQQQDDFYFSYANNLVADAVKKERPLFPFIKAVRNYKKDNCIDVERKLPPHLETHLQIGVKSAEPMKDDDGNLSPGVRKYGLDELKDLNPYSPRSQ